MAPKPYAEYEDLKNPKSGAHQVLSIQRIEVQAGFFFSIRKYWIGMTNC